MPAVHYLIDLPPDNPEFIVKQRTRHEHWLEPKYGPPPDHVGLLEYGAEDVVCALWMGANYCIVALEIPDRRRTKEETVWLLQNTRGWILQTRRWVEEDGVFRLGGDGAEVALVDFDTEDDKWREKIYREIMVQTTELVMKTPIGADMQSLVSS